MREFHRHDDVEVNVAVRGSLEYLLGGRRVTVPEGHTALFWAAVPHRLVPPEERRDSDICWIHLPLSTVLGWTLPEGAVARIVSHGVVVVPTAAVGEHVVAQFGTWQRDVSSGLSTATVLLEGQALLLRILAAEGSPDAAVTEASAGSRTDLRPVARMARFTAENFRSDISTADIARAANLNPNYATTLFRSAVGVTLGEQLLRHRIAEAQRLLLTTTLTTAAVAHAAGFGSGSSLYAHFSKACGCSPGAYRATRTVTPPVAARRS